MAKPVSLDGTEVHRLRSDEIGQDYLLNVALPPGYDPAGDPCPVVYLTDGGPAFISLLGVTPLMHLTGELAPFIIVGITYDVPDSRHSMTLRNRDLTHCKDEGALTGDEAPAWFAELPDAGQGGAAAFLRFIDQDVRAYIHSHFNAAADATYAGYSLGGLFGLYALFTAPATFTRYVIGSPSIWWSDRDILSVEAAYAANHDDLDATIFMSSGRLEEPAAGPDRFAMVSNMVGLVETLAGRGYANLRLEHTILDAETHLSGHPLAILRGLRAVFA